MRISSEDWKARWAYDCNTCSITFTSPFYNGRCLSSPIGWLTLGTTTNPNTCIKMSGVTQGATITLGGLKHEDQVVVWMHDGSFKTQTSSYTAMAAMLKNSCRSSSNTICGSFAAPEKFNCPECTGTVGR